MISINNVKKIALMQLKVSIKLQIITTLFIMLVLIGVVYQFNIPNPNVILLSGVVFCSALFGYGGGIFSGLAMLIYTLYFFSIDNSFVSFTDKDLSKVIVSLIGIITNIIFVCKLKRSEIHAFNEIQNLTNKLQAENEKLQEISLLDGLTGIKNRTALRKDYPIYENCDLTVMMLDLDNFKSINDQSGHEEGDRVIKETGSLLKKYFGLEHSYRYGGDEFLVIYPNISEKDFIEKINSFIKSRPIYKINNKKIEASYSIGYVQRALNDNHALRELFAIADERMYQAKKTGKNKVIGY